MIELLFVTCMAATAPQSEACRERSLLFTDVTPMMCMMGAQPQLAKWVQEHPGEQVRSWKCRVVDNSERDA
ncbi:hypothetical protein [Pseudooceanicola sp. HF7]|uniref:hypothetical protein n=1 Tax=Pseudooceanicola sp. HF7 TaxID=2721560 RepID=UPI00142F483D|nr:hypothetical protein [Pseudooceanicola sp. HF7]NIZ09396.1 hypothetical protein [Pseudooceanicola sp. HF7]